MSDPSVFHAYRPDSVHSEARSAQYGYVARQIRLAVEDLVRLASLRDGARVLDYGSATSPYRAIFGTGIEFVAADLPGNPASDVHLNADGTLPVPDGSFDLVLSTQVLEHVLDPAIYLSECFRVLRPGGHLVLTTHGIMYFHADPSDYWRWTHEGLIKVVVDAGFDVRESRGIMGLAAAAIQLFQDATLTRVPLFARSGYITCLQQAAKTIDKRYSEPARRRDSLVFGICASRPE
jgi:SAM-dependent methyltransferase